MPMKPTASPIPARRRPPWIMQHVLDPLTLWAVGIMGFDDHNGTRVLQVKGRTSGEWHATPVKLIEVDGRRYLVAMYGETQWVKNLRAQGCGRLRLGAAFTDFRAVELAREDKLPVRRAYTRRYWSLVSGMTTVTSPNATYEEIRKTGSMHPVFRLEYATSSPNHGTVINIFFACPTENRSRSQNPLFFPLDAVRGSAIVIP